jgi:hypothetical protein
MDADPEIKKQADLMASNMAQRATWSNGLDFEIEVRGIRLIGKDGKGVRLPEIKAANWIHSAAPGAKVNLAPQGGGARFSGNVAGGSWASMSVAPAGAGSSVDLSQASEIEFEARGKGSALLLLHHVSDTDWDDYGSTPFVLSSTWSKQRISIGALKQGGWGSPKAFDPKKIESLNFSMQVPYWPDYPEVVYNGMIAPLAPLAIQGVLWYQGESNAGRAGQYAKLLSILIGSWRKAWGLGDFPFLIVQLPNWAPGGGDWVKLRAAQAEVAAQVPSVGIIETMGLGDDNDIHPRNKSAVGQRLVGLALRQVYKK